MTRPNCLVVVGTRPEAIKMAPVVWSLREPSRELRTSLLLTGQHRELVQQVLEVFDLESDIDLELMEHGQTLSGFMKKALESLDTVYQAEQPDMVVVQGDTSTVLVASLAAFYRRIPIAHVEAGLRTSDLSSPFPEEGNRRLTSVLADLHFAPTQTAYENLCAERIDARKISITGNPVIDALRMIRDRASEVAQSAFPFLDADRRLIVVTAHRRENHGEPLENICRAVGDLVDDYSDIDVIWPVHPHPAVSATVHSALGAHERIHLTAPIDYCTFAGLIDRAAIVLTDSGGLQEEAPAFGTPVLTMRSTTERPEGVAAGNSRLVGTSAEKIYAQTALLLDDEDLYQQMSTAASPYGDGHAAERIADSIGAFLSLRREAPEPSHSYH